MMTSSLKNGSWKVIYFLIFCIMVTSATISTFHNQELQPSKFLTLRKGLYSQDDAKAALLFFASKQSSVRFSLHFSQKKKPQVDSAQKINLILFHSDDYKFIGEVNPQDHTQALCDTNGNFVGIKATHDRLLSKEITVPSNFKYTYDVTKSGIYYMILVSCGNPDTTATVNVDGQVYFKNPYGYLDAEEFGLLPFYGILSVLYLAAAIIWAIMNLLNWRELIRLQMVISGVLLLSMFETLLYYAHYFEVNSFGVVAPSLLSSANFMSLVRKTVARLLVLVVSLGYGMVKENLGTTSYTILVYGFVYFFSSCLAQITYIMYWKLHAITPLTASILSFPVVLLDVAFYVWVLLNITKIVHQLQVRKQTAKLTMYNAFKWLLFLYFGVSALWSIYETSLQVSTREEHDKRWETNWTTEAFWHLLYFIAFCFVMLIFRPSNNNLRFAAASVQPVEYEGLAEADPEETETFEIEVEMPEEPSTVVRGSSSADATPDTLSKISREKDAEQKPVVTTVPNNAQKEQEKKKKALTGFGLGDDDDEEEEPAKLE